MQRASYNQTVGVSVFGQPIRTKRDTVAAKALADAITTSRQGLGAAQTGLYAGRLDRRRLSRFAVGQTNIFMKPQAERPNNVRVTILVDASVSMKKRLVTFLDWAGVEREKVDSPTRYEVAARVARDLAEATEMLPWVTADVVAFTTGHSESQNVDSALVFPIWQTGESTDEMDMLGHVPMGYTEEGYALAMAWDEMKERLQGGEQGLVIIVSDGEPGEGNHVKSVVADMTREGIPVVSVAVIKAAAQPMMYGADNVIHFNGSSIALGYDMAKVIGGVL